MEELFNSLIDFAAQKPVMNQQKENTAPVKFTGKSNNDMFACLFVVLNYPFMIIKTLFSCKNTLMYGLIYCAVL